MRHDKRKIIPVFIISGLFFIFGVITLPHYGMNWDTNHFLRGQAYLHFKFLPE